MPRKTSDSCLLASFLLTSSVAGTKMLFASSSPFLLTGTWAVLFCTGPVRVHMFVVFNSGLKLHPCSKNASSVTLPRSEDEDIYPSAASFAGMSVEIGHQCDAHMQDAMKDQKGQLRNRGPFGAPFLRPEPHFACVICQRAMMRRRHLSRGQPLASPCPDSPSRLTRYAYVMRARTAGRAGDTRVLGTYREGTPIACARSNVPFCVT